MLKQNYQFKVTFSELKRIPLDHRQGLSKTKILRNDYIIVTLTDQNCGITESLRIWNPLPSFMLKILKNPQLWDIQYISIKLINEQAIEYDEFFCFIYLDAPVGKIMVSDIVVLKILPKEIRTSIEAYVGCLAGAVLKKEYVETVRRAGFKNIKIIDETNFPVELMINDPTAQEVIKKIQNLAVKTYKTLCCEGMARVDFFLNQNGQLFVNEINTIPGFTKISMYPKLWEISGISYTELIDRLINLAIERFEKEQRSTTRSEMYKMRRQDNIHNI